MELKPPEYMYTEVSACVEAVAEKYLRSKCLAFLFPLNFSDPSVADVAGLVRSDLLKSIHGRWAPFLPALIEDITRFNYQPPSGVLNHLRCAHIVILDNRKSYISQIEEIIYTLFGNNYQNGGGDKSRMVIVEPDDIQENRIYELLHYMYEKGDIDVVFAAGKQNAVTLYSYFPFGLDGKSCVEDNSVVEKLDSWVNGSFLLGRNLFPNKVPRIFNNCTCKVSTVNYPPFVMLCPDATRPCDGLDFRIFELISQHMGLRNSYVVYPTHSSFVSEIDGERHGAASDLQRGLVWLLMSAGSNLAYDYNCLFVPRPYMTSKTSWFFQNPEVVPNWKHIYLSFHHILWLVFIISTILFICSMLLISRIGRNFHHVKNFSKCIMANSNVEKGQHSRTSSFRLVFAMWLFYVFHIKLAYTASLTSIMTTGKWESKITSFDQILERGLTTIMPKLTYYLSLEVDEPIIKRVLSNSLVSDETDVTLPRMERFGNLTTLDEETYISYKIKQNKLKIYKSNLNIGMKSFGLKMRRNHFIADRISELSSRVLESGLAATIIDDYTVLCANKAKVAVEPFTLQDLTGSFLVLITGLLVSSLVFLGEILINRNLKLKL